MLSTVVLVWPAGSRVSGSTSMPILMPGVAAISVGATVGVGGRGVGGGSVGAGSLGNCGWHAAAKAAAAPTLSRRNNWRRFIGAIVDSGCSYGPANAFRKNL